jgi:hypothetical protein
MRCVSTGSSRYWRSSADKRSNVREFKTHVTYDVYGVSYCRLRGPGSRPKRLYATLQQAQAASDKALDYDTMLWEFVHYGHWHLTGLAPLLLRVLPPARRLKDGPGSKRSQLKHLVPFVRRPKGPRGYGGHHFIRMPT